MVSAISFSFAFGKSQPCLQLDAASSQWAAPSQTGYLQHSLALKTENQNSSVPFNIVPEISSAGASFLQPTEKFQKPQVSMSVSMAEKDISKSKLGFEECEKSLHRLQVSTEDDVQPPQKRSGISHDYYHVEQ